MGVCKAGLESLSRYLARDLGPAGIRVDLVAAGPIHTRAAGGIPGFDALLDAWATGSPMPWNPADPSPVADATCFLLSDLAAPLHQVHPASPDQRAASHDEERRWT